MTDRLTTRAGSGLSSIRHTALRWAFVAVLAGGCVPEKTPVAFDTPGGDAWTFEKVIEGSAPHISVDLHVALPRFLEPNGSCLCSDIGLNAAAFQWTCV
jgi:hypothetical protein